MSPEIASTWLKLTGKKRPREFSHSLDPELPFAAPGSGPSNSYKLTFEDPQEGARV